MKTTIIIPTRNGMPRFADVLDSVLSQKSAIPFELYCVDTESTDGTWEELERRGVRRSRIRRHEFDHGRTRNQAIRATDGDLVVLTVQDAVPADEHWLEALVEAVLSADDVAAAYSRQVPEEGLNPFLRLRLERWAAGKQERRVQCLEHGQTLAELPPLERLALCALDNVSSIIRRDVWERLPVPSRRFGEDVAWGKQVIESDLRIVFEPRSAVIHSHDDGALVEFKRIYLDHANLHELFDITTVPTARDAWRNSLAQYGLYRRMVDELAPPEGQRGRLLRFALRLAFAETFGQWLGARSKRKGLTGAFRWLDGVVD